MIVAGLERISTLITDDGARPVELDLFKAAGIHVIVAPVSDEDRFAKLA
jgi:hypothetical protein